jgi:hypothetical protein
MAKTDALRREGVEILDHYISPSVCRVLLDELHEYTALHDLPMIERSQSERSLRYRVIDGDRVFEALPAIVSLYRDVLALVRRIDPALEPLSNRTASLNVNFTPPGGEYRWHYDRNAVTAILFLNAVEGGETEMYPRFRVQVRRWKDRAIQRVLDAAVRRFASFIQPLVITPSPGKMILMHADRCLHSVRKVQGTEDRISVIMAFDPPGKVFSPQHDLDSYLYSLSAAPGRDPNYRQKGRGFSEIM